jgi:hypothetical protein
MEPAAAAQAAETEQQRLHRLINTDLTIDPPPPLETQSSYKKIWVLLLGKWPTWTGDQAHKRHTLKRLIMSNYFGFGAWIFKLRSKGKISENAKTVLIKCIRSIRAEFMNAAAGAVAPVVAAAAPEGGGKKRRQRKCITRRRRGGAIVSNNNTTMLKDDTDEMNVIEQALAESIAKEYGLSNEEFMSLLSQNNSNNSFNDDDLAALVDKLMETN